MEREKREEKKERHTIEFRNSIVSSLSDHRELETILIAFIYRNVAFRLLPCFCLANVDEHPLVRDCPRKLEIVLLLLLLLRSSSFLDL